jgi:acetoin utilization protein AcuB
MKTHLKIEQFMTRYPIVTSRTTSIQEAFSLIRKKGIRHLPVVDAQGQLVGLISDRDIKIAISLEGAERMTVEDLMISNTYFVENTASLHDVASSMAEKRLGCVPVLEKGQLVGIFTTEDALRSLSELVHSLPRQAVSDTSKKIAS